MGNTSQSYMYIYMHHLIVFINQISGTCRVDLANRIPKEAFNISQTLLSQDSLLAGSHIFARVILGRKFGLKRKEGCKQRKKNAD
jgi:hypothetical protein